MSVKKMLIILFILLIVIIALVGPRATIAIDGNPPAPYNTVAVEGEQQH